MIDKKLLSKKDKILALRTKVKDQGAAGKLNFEKEWARNIFFFVGRQWIEYGATRREWSDAKIEKWIPRPVTNKFASAVGTIKSVLIQKEPRLIVTPSTNSEEDVATSQIGDHMVDIVTEETEMKTEREIASSWNVLTGNVFFHTYCYTSKDFGRTFVGHERCEACNVVVPPDTIAENKCPGCGEKDKMVKAINEKGEEMGEYFDKSKIKTDTVSPFEMFFNQEVEKFEDVRCVVRSKIKPIDELKDMYPAIADKIVEKGEGEDQSRTFLKAFSYITSNSGASSNGGTGGKGKIPTASIDYLYSLPDNEFPDGVCAHIINEEIVELSDMKENMDSEENYSLPFVHIGCLFVPGRFWRKTLIDDLAHKQVQRNKAESLTELGIFTMSNPVWLEPVGSNMDNPTGESGQKLQYEHDPSRPAPSRMDGKDIPQSVFKYIEMIDKDFQDLAHLYDVLQGNLPKGLDTFSGLRLLTEQAFSNHLEMIKNWERGNAKVCKQQIELARKHFVEPRKKTFENEFGSWETKVFTRADLQGGVDVRTEEGSSVPKSKAVEDAAIVDSIKLGLVNIQDPGVNAKILERFGQSDLTGTVNLDIKDAMHEWKEFLDSVKESPADPMKWKIRPRQGIDNDMIHYADAMNRAKTEEFFALPDPAKAMWVNHVTYHKTILENEQAKAAEAQAAMAAQPKPAMAAA